MEGIDEYASIYWAAACLVFWAGCGVTDGQLCDAVESICRDAELDLPHEALLKRMVNEMTTKGK